MNNYLGMVQEILDPGGKMEQFLEGYTHREEQQRFAAAVARAFKNESFLTAEAGTGVGKTYGYLVPALIWAKQSQEKIVISTKTKALQQQIIDRDLPQLEKAMNNKLSYAEAKGRDNFLCWHKYQQILAGKKQLETDQLAFIETILTWAEATKGGDRKELGLNQELMKNWPVVAADRNNCQRDLCRYRDKCFRLKMIKNMNKAHVIVTNHALLLSDILVDNSILPEFHHLIIDEAHTFTKECFDRLAHRFSMFDTLNLLQALYLKDKRLKKGYLNHLRSAFPHLGDLINEASRLVENVTRANKALFDRISKGIRYRDDFNFSHVLNPADRERSWFADSLDIYLQDWKPHMDLLLQKLGDLVQELEENYEGSDLQGITNALQEIDDVVFTIMTEDIHSVSNITWLECTKGKAVAICSSEVQSYNMLDRQLYQKLKTLVMVSATLAIEESFDHFIERSGLIQYAEEGKLETLLEKSPFNYQRQACMYLVKDMPDPGSLEFNQAVSQILAQVFATQGGQTMVLFTSRKQLQETANDLRDYCRQHNLNLLVQHEDGEFASLVQEFVSTSNSILMGVETFWEGIDLKGEVLKCLVIVKLPFRSPSDPYCSAWEQYYKMQGKNSFANFMLPDAAVRFKQGVGRLIRSETDSGAVVVLDTRLIYRKYGTVFKNSIPIKNLITLPGKELQQQLESRVIQK